MKIGFIAIDGRKWGLAPPAIMRVFGVLLLFSLTGCATFRYSPNGGISRLNPTTTKGTPVDASVSLQPAQISCRGTVDLDYLTGQLEAGLKGTGLFRNLGTGVPNPRYVITPTVFRLTDVFDNVVHLQLNVQHSTTHRNLYGVALMGSGFSKSQSIGYLKDSMSTIGSEIAQAIAVFETTPLADANVAKPTSTDLRTGVRQSKPVTLPKRTWPAVNIAVADITAYALSQGEAKTLTERVHSTLVSTDYFTVLSRSDMKAVLEAQRFQRTDACDDTACLVEMGKILSVQKIVGGTLGRVGSTYSVSLRFVDVETGKTEFSADDEWRGEADALLSLVQDTAKALAGEYARRKTTE
jgi:hypothetical protein